LAAVQDDRQRIDRWLWHARVVRTRTSAASLAASGHVRVNGQRIDASARAVKPGDVLTIALPNTVKILRIVGFSVRREGFSEAKCLYEDLTPPKEIESRPADVGSRGAGLGRPTKKDRRAIDRLRGWDPDR
jgi:ribosome-associated heat shock protein Hsp15